VHFALGSSAGTENDTCVSARIKIFIMMIRIILITKTMDRRTLLITMMMKVTQKYVATDCTDIPLNFVVDPFFTMENFSLLITLTLLNSDDECDLYHRSVKKNHANFHYIKEMVIFSVYVLSLLHIVG
jgi:hypothetical protein